MQEQLKEQWIRALENRDGHYKKTDAGLHVGDCHCGLGVLADVSDLDQFDAGEDYFGYKFGSISSYVSRWNEGDMVTGLSKEFLEHIDLSKADHDAIMSLNDVDDGNSYQSVIDYIRANV